jgi:hypothetical protein
MILVATTTPKSAAAIFPRRFFMLHVLQMAT